MHAFWLQASLVFLHREKGVDFRCPLPPPHSNSVTCHLSTKLQLGIGVSPMPRHRRAEDVGNLSGQPNPPLLTLVYVSTFKHACAQEVGQGGLQGLSPGISQPLSPVQAVPDKSVSVAVLAALMLMDVSMEAGASRSHPSANCDVHATQHRETFVTPTT